MRTATGNEGPSRGAVRWGQQGSQRGRGGSRGRTPHLEPSCGRAWSLERLSFSDPPGGRRSLPGFGRHLAGPAHFRSYLGGGGEGLVGGVFAGAGLCRLWVRVPLGCSSLILAWGLAAPACFLPSNTWMNVILRLRSSFLRPPPRPLHTHFHPRPISRWCPRNHPEWTLTRVMLSPFIVSPPVVLLLIDLSPSWNIVSRPPQHSDTLESQEPPKGFLQTGPWTSEFLAPQAYSPAVQCKLSGFAPLQKKSVGLFLAQVN
jgi:hypothetical protein